MISPRILSFVALVAIAVTTQLAFKLSQNSSGKYEYNTQSAMTIVEFIKLLLACTLFQMGRRDEDGQSLTTIFRTIPPRVYRNYFYLALSYGVYNQLIFTVMESSIDVGTFSLLKSTTPAIVSGLNWWFLGSQLTFQQTLCMLIQCFGIVPVVLSSSSSSKVQFEFRPQDIALMLFCCCMASLNTVFNAVVIKSESNISIHVQNIILYSYGVIANLMLYVIANLMLYLTISPVGSYFFYGFGQPRVIFLMILNSFVGLAITMIYKYGDAVLKTLTQPLASSILVFLSHAAFGQKLDAIKAAGAGVVIVDTLLYLYLPSAPSTMETNDPEADKSSTRRKRRLDLAILCCAFLGLNYMSASHITLLAEDLQNFSLETHKKRDGSLSIVLIIQALRVEDTIGIKNETKKQIMMADNKAKVELLELYRPFFADVYYETPQYVGQNNLNVACQEPAFDGIRSKCWSCTDLEPLAAWGMEEHRFACAAELFSFVEAMTSDDDYENRIKGYLVIHADFYLTPGFVQQAQVVLEEHPSSIWTSGGAYWDGGPSGPATREAAWSPLNFTSLPSPRAGWKWWNVYGPRLDDARAHAAQRIPSLVETKKEKMAPMFNHDHSHWADLYFVPASISQRFGVFARLMKQYRIVNEVAVFESLYLAGIHGRVDGEYNFKCYGQCCVSVEPDKLWNASFLEEYPCGHKIQLQDSETRAALTAAWTKANSSLILSRSAAVRRRHNTSNTTGRKRT